MKSLSSIEIKAVVAELQSFIDGKVDQVYQPDNSEVTITLYKNEVGRKHLRIIPGMVLYLSSKKRQSPKLPINFCRFLRKRLNNARVRKIVQKNMERIVEFHIEGKEQNFILICEFFSKGNIILCDEEYTIISALMVQHWKDRKIKAKVEYKYPPSKRTSFTDVEDFAMFLEKSEKETVVKKLASGINLGGLYAEEVCFRAGVQKNAQDLDNNEIKKLYNPISMANY